MKAAPSFRTCKSNFLCPCACFADILIALVFFSGDFLRLSRVSLSETFPRRIAKPLDVEVRYLFPDSDRNLNPYAVSRNPVLSFAHDSVCVSVFFANARLPILDYLTDLQKIENTSGKLLFVFPLFESAPYYNYPSDIRRRFFPFSPQTPK